MDRIPFAVQLDDLDDAHLEQLVHVRNLVEMLQDVFHSLGHGAVRQEHESVPFTGGI